MKSLINIKTQFNEVLTRSELKTIIGGAIAKCSIECEDAPPAECEGPNCQAIDGYGCRTEGGPWKLCEVIINN